MFVGGNGEGEGQMLIIPQYGLYQNYETGQCYGWMPHPLEPMLLLNYVGRRKKHTMTLQELVTLFRLSHLWRNL